MLSSWISTCAVLLYALFVVCGVASDGHLLGESCPAGFPLVLFYYMPYWLFVALLLMVICWESVVLLDFRLYCLLYALLVVCGVASDGHLLGECCLLGFPLVLFYYMPYWLFVALLLMAICWERAVLLDIHLHCFSICLIGCLWPCF